MALSDADGRSRLAPPVTVFAPEPSADARPLPRSSSPAANQRLRKQQRPELYCTDARCLWMTGGGPCPKHGGPAWTKERERLARKRSRGEATPEELALLLELSQV